MSLLSPAFASSLTPTPSPRRPRATDALRAKPAPPPLPAELTSAPSRSRARMLLGGRGRGSPTPSPIFGARRPAGPAPAILVLGGASALGREIGRRFSASGWRVVSLDFYDSSVPACGVNGCALPSDPRAPVSLALPSGAPVTMQMRVAEDCLQKAGVEEVAVCVNATLGYVTGGIGDEALFEKLEYMSHTSLESSLMCARLAHNFLAPEGLLAMLGSKAALTPQPAMLGFSMCKAAVHQLVRSLALTVGNELPEGCTVLALVPEVLDTPLHREMNKGQSASNWTPCDAVAQKLLQWATIADSRPPNASFISISTSSDKQQDSKHQFRLIDSPPAFVQRTTL